MKKIITVEQLDKVLALAYQTNITAKDFDALRNFLSALPNLEEKKPKESKKESKKE